MAMDLEKEKKDFIAKHKIKEHHNEQFTSVKLAKDQTVISLPSKRGRDPNDEDDEPAEPKSKKDKKDKKKHNHKRFKKWALIN